MRAIQELHIPPQALAACDLGFLEAWARRELERERLPLRRWMALAEAWRILQALERAQGNRSAAAEALGIGRRTLYAKLERLGLPGAWRVWRPRRRPQERGAPAPRWRSDP